MSELRYHPFLNQWVITATHRQDRTFLPPADYNPLAPTQPGGFPTEIPFPEYDLVVFENKFPSLNPVPPVPAVEGTSLTPVLPAGGVCEVICYTSNATASLAQMPYHQVRKLARVWKHRYEALSAREEVEYVFIFENKGKEIGVTLFHPHGQIYAYPFIPPIPAQELAAERAYYEEHHRPLMAAVIEQTAPTTVWENEGFIVFVPFFARYPYETYIAPKRHIASLAEMTERDLDLLSEALLVMAKKYDGLFGFSLPYIMAIHQKPSMPGYDFAWFHIEFYPPYRTAEKLKYLAGSEAGAGAFINDTLPEVTAATLRAIDVTLG